MSPLLSDWCLMNTRDVARTLTSDDEGCAGAKLNTTAFCLDTSHPRTTRALTKLNATTRAVRLGALAYVLYKRRWTCLMVSLLYADPLSGVISPVMSHCSHRLVSTGRRYSALNGTSI